MSELAESDTEINGGDREDNFTYNSDDEDELDRSLSLEGDKN